MNYSDFYKEHKSVIDEHLRPLMPQGCTNIVGGRPAFMYRQWAFYLASKMDELLNNNLIGGGLCYRERMDDEYFTVHDWDAIDKAFRRFLTYLNKSWPSYWDEKILP